METFLFWIVPASSILALLACMVLLQTNDAGERRNPYHG